MRYINLVDLNCAPYMNENNFMNMNMNEDNFMNMNMNEDNFRKSIFHIELDIDIDIIIDIDIDIGVKFDGGLNFVPCKSEHIIPEIISDTKFDTLMPIFRAKFITDMNSIIGIVMNIVSKVIVIVLI